MWSSICRQLWNQRRATAWIWVELMVVIVLLWYAIDLIFNYEGAAMQPKGYDTACVFELKVETKPLEMLSDDDNRQAGEDFDYLYHQIKSYPGVEAVGSYYGTVPYSEQKMYEGYCAHTDSAHVVNCYIRYATPDYFQVFPLQPMAGSIEPERWRASEYPMPALMSAQLADSLFHTTPTDALGRTCFNPYWLGSKNPVTNYRLMAVLPPHKTDDYQRYEPFIYLPTSTPRPLWWHNIVLRVHPDRVAGFAERFRADMQQAFDRGIFYLASIRSYSDMKEAYDIEQGTVNYLNTAYSVILFFVFNIFLGILGTFWLRIRKRRSEIALRMSLGCSRRGVMAYYQTEGLLLLLTAAVPALLICFNIRLADLTVHTLMDDTACRFIFCFVATLLLLALVIAVSIWFPARKAIQIEPAEALHDE